MGSATLYGDCSQDCCDDCSNEFKDFGYIGPIYFNHSFFEFSDLSLELREELSREFREIKG